ncbi:MAG: redoxin domain-containing protein [Chloroflexi bacterium]|nr:redoxin domain-containing protein [Chloroflexota bacterium]MCC6894330.1 redoxin domain-containing protein [Anaerolineae bacterium]
MPNENTRLQRRVLRAPEFVPGDWLNTERPLSMAGLRGRAVLVDIWEYSCVNCLRTLPYLREWNRRYGKWLTVIGVHTPEFPFGKEKPQIEHAIQENDLTYPVFLDNHFAMWDAYANRYWPAKYLIDPDGYIRYQNAGEGGYGLFEEAIQAVLREHDSDLTLPPVMQPIRDEDRPGAVCYRPTPELHAGLDRGALGNPEGYGRGVPMIYMMPKPKDRLRNNFYVSGAWQAGEQYLTYQGQTEAVVNLPYEAVEVNVVMTPYADMVDRMVHPEAVTVEVWQDDQPIAEATLGEDVTADGRVLVDRPRMYNLVRNKGFEQHELTLRVRSRGFALYAFSFTGCVKPD